MALFRALESVRPESQRLFEDPYASGFLRPALRLGVQFARLPALGALVSWWIDRRWPGARSSAVARTRLIDDLLLAALGEGFEQVVLLGAGFDARAHRLPGIEGARVFETDHPRTLAVKKARLRSMLGRWPEHVQPVEVDFEHDPLETALRASGLQRTARTFFVWEGVTNYLTREAVDATLHSVATLAAADSRLLFTYVHRGLLDGSLAFAGTRRLAKTLHRVGEPWTFGLDPAELEPFLAARGFRLLGDWGAADYRSKYLGARARRERGYEFYRAALAQILPRGGSARSGSESESERILRSVDTCRR